MARPQGQRVHEDIKRGRGGDAEKVTGRDEYEKKGRRESKKEWREAKRLLFEVFLALVVS